MFGTRTWIEEMLEMKLMFLDWILVGHNFGYLTQSKLDLGHVPMYLINSKLTYSFWIFLNLIIKIKFSIEVEATLLIFIVTSCGGPKSKFLFKTSSGHSHNPNSQKWHQIVKKNNQNWIDIYVLPFKAMAIIVSYIFHRNVKEFKPKIHLMKF